MEKAKRKNDTPDVRRYWRFFLPLTIVLGMMVKFPIRILIGESLCDVVLYGTISLICLAVAIRLYRRFGKLVRRLTVVIILCSLLSGWQVFDLTILRNQSLLSHWAYPVWGTDTDGPSSHRWASYTPRFRDDSVPCHSITERYFGSHIIAITLDIYRYSIGSACQG